MGPTELDDRLAKEFDPLLWANEWLYTLCIVVHVSETVSAVSSYLASSSLGEQLGLSSSLAKGLQRKDKLYLATGSWLPAMNTSTELFCDDLAYLWNLCTHGLLGSAFFVGAEPSSLSFDCDDEVFFIIRTSVDQNWNGTVLIAALDGLLHHVK